jgi:hypothetical protein
MEVWLLLLAIVVSYLATVHRNFRENKAIMALPVELLERCKKVIEGNMVAENKPMPEGFCITENIPLNRITYFFDQAAYDELHVEGDRILTQWVNGKWEDKE